MGKEREEELRMEQEIYRVSIGGCSREGCSFKRDQARILPNLYLCSVRFILRIPGISCCNCKKRSCIFANNRFDISYLAIQQLKKKKQLTKHLKEKYKHTQPQSTDSNPP